MNIKSDSYYLLQGEELVSILTRIKDVIIEIEEIVSYKTTTFNTPDGGEGLIYFDL
jgi:hypothetical protein